MFLVLKVFVVNLSDNLSTTLVEDLSESEISVRKLSGISKISSFSSISGDSILVFGEEFYINCHLDLYKEIKLLTNNPIVFIVSDQREKEKLKVFKSSMESDDNLIFVSESGFSSSIIKKIHEKKSKVKTRKFPITYDDIRIDLDNISCIAKECIKSIGGECEILLTRTEINILYYLFASKGKSSSYEDLTVIFEIQGKKINNNTLSSHIRNIKNKIYKATGKKDFIKSIYGYGYRL
jgi:DNA-binding response OmpR family regulator